MNEIDARELALQLANCETEESVIQVLKSRNLWDNEKNWRSFGDNDNNYSIIGNQQSSAEGALVEKLINSVDAVLLKECKIRKIDPEGDKAPRNSKEAIRQFYGIDDGTFLNVKTSERNRISKEIILAASSRDNLQKGTDLNYSIIDRGEGQTPNQMPNTILSISKSNKLKIPFVQGKFNMGGTGVLNFGGKNDFNIIISKKCPDIPNVENDPSFSKWSITVVRKELPKNGRKSSMFTYLTDSDGALFQFSADELQIVPVSTGGAKENLQYGTFIKLINYDLKGMKSNILFDLNYRLALLVPSFSHPIRLVESRNYTGHSKENTLSGLLVRLNDDRIEKIEPNFPTAFNFYVDEQLFKCKVVLFKGTDEIKKYRKKEAVLFVVNGQTHAALSESFLTNRKAGYSYIADSLIVIVDCSEIDVTHSEQLFMSSRDRLRKSDFKDRVIDELLENLKNCQLLRMAQNQRRERMVRNKVSDKLTVLEATEKSRL